MLTLDADSLLEPRYVVRLVHFLERPEKSQIALAQTPYSAIPDAARSIERIAGATTDIQYVIHQGFSSAWGNILGGGRCASSEASPRGHRHHRS